MPVDNSYSYLVGPMVAFVALGVIVLLCRWVFSTSTRDARTAARAEAVKSRGDYGLRVPIATVRTADDGAMLAGVLREAGIRCTLTRGAEPGEHSLLVFRDDALRARDLVSS